MPDPAYLAELVDRTWRIGWSTAPLLLAVLVLGRGRGRPAVLHAAAAGAALALLLPLVLPVRRHVFELGVAPAAAVESWPPGPLTGGFPAPVGLALAPAALLLALLVLRARRFRRRLAGCAPVPAALEREVARLARELGLRRAPRTAWSAAGEGPLAVWGPRRSRLLLPRGRWERWSAAERELVLLHELAHLRRRDGPVQLVAAAAAAVFWWNPLAWGLALLSRELAELACDRWVTRFRGGARETYCLLYTSPSPRDQRGSRMPSSA